MFEKRVCIMMIAIKIIQSTHWISKIAQFITSDRRHQYVTSHMDLSHFGVD